VPLPCHCEPARQSASGHGAPGLPFDSRRSFGQTFDYDDAASGRSKDPLV